MRKTLLFLAITMASFSIVQGEKATRPLSTYELSKYYSKQVEIDGITWGLESKDSTASLVTISESNLAADSSLVIPSTVTYDGITYTVDCIGRYAMHDSGDVRNKLKSVTLPSGLKYIGVGAFQNCVELIEVKNEPESLDHCSVDIFVNTKLSKIAKDNAVYLGGWLVDTYDRTLKEFHVKDGTRAICSDLRGYFNKIYIPASVTYISPYPFQNKSSIKEFIVDENNTEYTAINGSLYGTGEYVYNSTDTATGAFMIAYAGGNTPDTLALPNGIKGVDIDAMRYCWAKVVTFPEGFESIENYGLIGSSSLTSVDFPSTTKYIGSYVFSSCGKLTSVTIRSTTPPTLRAKTFETYHLNNNITFYVPAEAVETYKAADVFKDAKAILPIEESAPTAINTVNRADATPIAIYNTAGQQIPALQKGINIMKMSDGTSKKVLK